MICYLGEGGGNSTHICFCVLGKWNQNMSCYLGEGGNSTHICFCVSGKRNQNMLGSTVSLFVWAKVAFPQYMRKPKHPFA